ncbi:MAG: DUF255 domain-containing protein, partial [Nanoarchaeota archaeon]
MFSSVAMGRYVQKQKRKIRLVAAVFCIAFLAALLTSSIMTKAEEEYTRERSEELFHLIKWQDYSPETFNKALNEQKPIFLVLSAPAWCYWCHVYESEDYLYHPELYPYINKNFVPVFIDSDKRPDLTKKYLEGGWPSTTILSPDSRRITGFVGPRDPKSLGAYFEQLVNYLKGKSFKEFSVSLNYEETKPKIPDSTGLMQIEAGFLAYLDEHFDKSYGGFVYGAAQDWREGQKFPSSLTYKYLLEKYDETGNKDYIGMVKTTFDNQYTNIEELGTMYRLYDPVEGGFHRYSTKADWTVPHYEKLLQDQARLLRAYAHLSQLINDSNVKTAVNGTISFIQKKFYDDQGGFYSSQDAYLEEEYYGLTKEQREKVTPPFIDKTRRTDSNSMMISTFLYLYDTYDTTGKRKGEYKEIAEKSLDFLQKNMVGSEGAYYYFDYDKRKPFLTGQSVSNSWAILAFLDGYEAFEEPSYLKTAEQLAKYSLDSLYDWKSGGFFERNSKDASFYAPNERVDLSKPYEENAVFSYAMLRLYVITGNLEYLESGLKTIGFLLGRAGGLDESYYMIKASRLALDNNLIDAYDKNEGKING